MRNPLRALFEQRSIGSSHDLWTYLSRGSVSSSGAVVNEQTAFAVPVVLTCVSLISRTIMTLPVDVYERLPGGRKRKADEHPLARLFDNPNSWQTWPMFCQMMQAHLLLRGNAYAWVNWVGVKGSDFAQADEIIPLHPDQIRVEPIETPRSGPGYELKYTLTRRNGQQVVLPSDEVMHLRGLTTNGYTGRNFIDDLKDAIGNAISTQDYSGNLWKRGGTPPLVLKHPKTLSPKAQTGLEEKWEQTYGGKDGRRVAVIEEGMEIEQLSVTPEQGQFLETNKFSRSQLAGAFHVPPHMIGDTEKSTSWGTGIEQQQIGYLTFTIQPWLTVWEHGIRRALIANERRFYVKFKVEGLLRGDSAGRSSFYQKMFGVGAFSPNTILALEDMDPIGDEGDVRYVPSNYVPLGTPPDQISEAARAAGALVQQSAELSELIATLKGEPTQVES
jgi:HK97 family phage portal protein